MTHSVTHFVTIPVGREKSLKGMSYSHPAEVGPGDLVEVGQLFEPRAPLRVQVDLLLPHDQPSLGWEPHNHHQSHLPTPPSHLPSLYHNRHPALTGRLRDLAPHEALLRPLQHVRLADDLPPGHVTPPALLVLKL